MNGYNFTERTRKVLALAREEATRLECEYVDADLILLGVIREGEGLGAVALAVLGGDLDDLRVAVEAAIRRGDSTASRAPDLPFTSRAKRVLQCSMEVARELQHTYVGTEHLLLGYLRDGNGRAMESLSESGITFETARVAVIRMLGDPRADQTSDGPAGVTQSAPLGADIQVRLADGRVIRKECATLRDAMTFLVMNGMT